MFSFGIIFIERNRHPTKMCMLCLVRDGLKFFLCSLSLVTTIQSYSLNEVNLDEMKNQTAEVYLKPRAGPWSQRLLCDTISISVKFYKNTLILNSLYSAPTHYILPMPSGAVHPSGASQSFSTIFVWFFFLGIGKIYLALKKKISTSIN